MDRIATPTATLLASLVWWCLAGHSAADETRGSIPRFFAEGTIEYRPGSLPVIIAAPHGGRMEPTEIPDRKSGVLTRDTETDLLALDLADAMARESGARPHLVICHLKRSKVDCNRDALTGTGGNPKALATWRAFHDAIGMARAVEGRGLFLDLHGHSHPVARVEIGYLLDAGQLRRSGEEFAALASVSSIASIAESSPTSFEDLIRGPESLGAMLEREGFASVPSPATPDPSDLPFFRGGYNTARYGPAGNDGRFFSIQIECPRPGLRDTAENRKRFAEAMAGCLEQWMERHAAIDLQSETVSGPRGGSE